MTEQALPVNAFNDGLDLKLPSFKDQAAITLSISKLREGERRLIEARVVNLITYNDLEYCFGEAYRECKTNLSTVGYLILKTENELEKVKAIAIMDKYQEYIKGKPAKFDTADTRKSFLALDVDVTQAKERLDSLKILEFFLDSRVKVMENVSRYMKKTIDADVRSGINQQKYGR